MASKLNLLVLHGFVQTADQVARNTVPLREALDDVAVLHYLEGPANPESSSRPWWNTGSDRWELTLRYWSDELSRKQYDGIIGLSQGAAKAAVLITMLNQPDKFPGFVAELKQPIKFLILCSGFVSSYNYNGKQHFVEIPPELPTLHTLDMNDSIVPAADSLRLFKACKTSIHLKHDLGHAFLSLETFHS
ncbi:serine hydrolase FSH [Mycena floridula]|nr:serine hydrolase FSH [Mycena floridula]